MKLPLTCLVERIGDALAGAIDELAPAVDAALALAAADPRLLSGAQTLGRADCYARHILHADPHGRFAIVSIVWRPGQRTPVHGHYTWCGYAVVNGSLHEESYVQAHPAAVRRIASADRSAGYVCFTHAGIEPAHCLGNCGNADAVSLHVYGIDGERVGTHVNRVVRAI